MAACYRGFPHQSSILERKLDTKPLRMAVWVRKWLIWLPFNRQGCGCNFSAHLRHLLFFKSLTFASHLLRWKRSFFNRSHMNSSPLLCVWFFPPIQHNWEPFYRCSLGQINNTLLFPDCFFYFLFFSASIQKLKITIMRLLDFRQSGKNKNALDVPVQLPLLALRDL